MEYPIIKLRDNPAMLEAMAGWFPHTFGVPEAAYRESMEQCLAGAGPVPQWYVAMEGGVVIAGLGVIENDFHPRTDLAPNVCAVYVEEPYRGRGLARALLHTACTDMAGLGVDTLYLVTGHTSFYERCGWEYFCPVTLEEGVRRMYRKVSRRITPCGDDCLQCPRYLARTEDELRALAELWHRVGWRESPPPPEEMRCGGCSSHRACAYGLTDCLAAHGKESCAQCGEFPCKRIRGLLEQSKAGQARCRAACTPQEYARLERAFFHKEENLGPTGR